MYHHKFSLARERGATTKATSSARSKSFKSKAASKSSRTARHSGLLRCSQSSPSIRAQILTARDHYRSCFGRDPRGIWLPECAYVPASRNFCRSAKHSAGFTSTRTAFCTPNRVRVTELSRRFLRPMASPRSGAILIRRAAVWSKHEGIPATRVTADFYRDVGFDLDFDYVKRICPSPQNRGFTGIKYYKITGGAADKQIYDRSAALQAASEHAQHFLNERVAQIQKLAGLLIVRRLSSRRMTRNCSATGGMKAGVSGFFARKLSTTQKDISLITPGDISRGIRRTRFATPSASSCWARKVNLARG